MTDQTLQCHLSHAITLTRPSGEVVHLSQEELSRILQSLVAWGVLSVHDPRSGQPMFGDDVLLSAEPGGGYSLALPLTPAMPASARLRTPLIPGHAPDSPGSSPW